MSRNLLTVLNLGGDALHASVLAWLLEPGGEHGLETALLERFVAFLDRKSIRWPGAGLGGIRARAGVRDGVHEVELSGGPAGPLVLVIGGHTPGADQRLDVLLAEERLAVGVQLLPAAIGPQACKTHAVWTGQDLLALLDDLEPGDDPYRHFLAQYGARLRELVRVQSGRRARPDSRRGVQRPSDSGRVARPSDSGRVPRPSSGRVPPTSDSGRVPRPLLDERPQKTARDTERVRRYVERSSPSAAGKALLEQQLAAMQAEEDYPDEPDMNLEAEMLPSDDMSRVYLVQKMIGRGGQGYVFEVDIQGSQEFPGFSRPVERAVLKIARGGANEALEREKQIYSKPDRGIVKLLDSGTANDSLYLVLEKLHPHPGQRFKGTRVDVATAIDIYAHLLEVLQSIHYGERSLYLFDIKPDNIMLRMSNAQGEVGEEEYLRRIATGAYEPVFMDMGVAMDRAEVDAVQGKLNSLIGTPVYLPPESIPSLDGEQVEATYSDKTDVYALTLSLYEMLTGRRAYEHRGLYKLKGQDLLLELIALKHESVDPVDARQLERALDQGYEEVLEILRAGLEPDPRKRSGAPELLNLVKKRFELTERRTKEVGDYHFDAVKGLRTWQTRFPRIDPARNRYAISKG